MIFETSRKWLKTEYVKVGDSIKILDEGEFVTSSKFTNKDGTPKKDYVCKVEHNEKEADMTINSTKKKTLIKAFGKDTKDWVGKVCTVEISNVMVGENMRKTIILIPITSKTELAYEA